MKINSLVSYDTAVKYNRMFNRKPLSQMGFYSKYYHRSTRSVLSKGRTGRVKPEDLLTAPYNYELEEFLRTNIGIHVYVVPVPLAEGVLYKGYVFRNGRTTYIDGHYTLYDAYQSAFQSVLDVLISEKEKLNSK